MPHTGNPYEPDPCYNGVTTLRFGMLCDESSPTMQQWCADPTKDHNVLDGVDLCADYAFSEQPATPTYLPSTGMGSDLAAGGSVALLVGVVLSLAARRRTVSA